MTRSSWVRANWDRVAGWCLIAAGCVVLFLGWRGVSEQVFPAAQLPYIASGGVGGAVIVGIGATLLVSADLRDEWQRLDDIACLLEAQADQRPAPTAPAEDDGAVGVET